MNKKDFFWPTIEHMRGPLAVVVDSLMIAFFLDHEKCNDSKPAVRAFADFFDGIGRNKSYFYVDKEGCAAQLSADKMIFVQKEVAEQTATGEIVELIFFDKQSPRRCHTHYLHNPTISKDEWPDKKSYIRFRIPQDTLFRGGVGEVLSFVDRLSGLLPYSYGYVSPALSYGEFFMDALPYIHRYPGFDVVDQSSVSFDLGSRPIGAYWVNIFGPKLSDALGGPDALRSALPEEARVDPCGRGGTRVVLGEAPEVGDVNRQNNLPLYRNLAAILRPHMRVPEVLYFTDKYGMADTDVQNSWHNRFFDD